MKRLALLAVFFLAISFQGWGALQVASADTLLPAQPVEVRYNCRWGCAAGTGGGGQANVTSASICAATCVAACGGEEENCSWFDYNSAQASHDFGRLNP